MDGFGLQQQERPCSRFNKGQDIIIVYVHASSLRMIVARLTLRGRDDNALSIVGTRAERIRAEKLAICIWLQPSRLPACCSRHHRAWGGRERRKRKITRDEKEASVLGFSLAKRPRGSGTTGKKDKEDAKKMEWDSREACCCCCCFFLKRDAFLVKGKKKKREIAGGRAREEARHRYEKLFLIRSCRFSKFIGN